MSEPAAPPHVEVKEGDILAGKYRVEQILGAGGMGVVVAATHIVLQNRVALKFLLPSVAKHEQTAVRFLREAQAAVKIKSPHVARVIDVGQMEDTGSPYMVMEFLEGKDLGEILEAEGALDIERACLFALQACEALAAAHSSGIVHRDIKPANLFLTRSTDGSPLIKVLDFGISKNTLDMGISNLTQTQVSMGSPLYMSPEQMRSARDVDARTDVWSMGVVLFEMLTGQLPFMAETMPQLCALVLEDEAPRADTLRPGLPEALVSATARCLEKDRERRFTDVGELAEAIAGFVPTWGQQSAERTSRIITGSGLTRTVEVKEMASPALDVGVVAPPPKLRGTATAFGRTGGASKAPRASIGKWFSIGAAAVALVSTGVFVAMTGNEDDAPPSGAALSRLEAAGALPPGSTSDSESKPGTPVEEAPKGDRGETPDGDSEPSAMENGSPGASGTATGETGAETAEQVSPSATPEAPSVATEPKPASPKKNKPKPKAPGDDKDLFGDRF